MNIDNIINEIMQFYSTIYTKTGLDSRQLLIIALVVLLLLLVFLRHLRKTNTKKITKSAKRPEIIGVKLSESQRKHKTRENVKEQKAAFFHKEDELNKPWGQTTKDWRQLREKIMQLKHDIQRQEHSQNHLKSLITELKNANEQLHLEINKHIKIETELRQQINEFSKADPTQIQKEINKKENTTENEQDVKEKQPVQQSSVLKQDKQEDTLKNSENITKESDTQRAFDENSQQEISESLSVNNDTLEKTQVKDAEKADEIEIENSVPLDILDIKELKTIADLANRLQKRSQQRQNKQP